MILAAMPETAINEYCEPGFEKYKIWRTSQRVIASPSLNAVLFKKFY